MNNKPNTVPPKKPNNVPSSTPNAASQDDFETKTFSAKIIKNSALKTILDLTYNETALKQCLLQIEGVLENYHLMRLGILRNSQQAAEDAGSPSKDLIAPANRPTENSLL